ncbi:hypothetical protein HLB42_09665 [Deinococcus sp. D7000]|nr:hypothetical protein HLB42_09665 [Deinococcus sp. D7000]
MLQTGTYSIRDLLAFNQTPTAQYDPAAIAQALADDNASHNRNVQAMLSAFAEVTTERVGAVPTPGTGSMIRVNEDGAVQTRKTPTPDQQNYPLYKFQHGAGMTEDYLMRATPSDLAIIQRTAQRAHINSLRLEMLKALLNPTNRQERDRFRDGMQLKVKALHNGDGVAPYGGPNGEVFDGTHSHYLAAATVTAVAVSGLIATVGEHTDNANIQLWISRAQEADVRALPGFSAYLDSRVIPAALLANTQYLVGNQGLDQSNPGNRAIGIYDGAEVFVKPYIPANYLTALDANATSKPLRQRQSDLAAQRGLRLAGGSMAHPLEARYWEDYFGFGAHDRAAAAALYIGGASYVAPTLGG